VAQVVVRNLGADVKARLKRRAERNGRSMEEEIRQILRHAARDSNRPVAKLGTRIAKRFAGTGIRSELPELRGHTALPAELKP
jgi:plasmid stability protein